MMIKGFMFLGLAPNIAALSPIIYALTVSTWAGKLILIVLFVLSIVAWSVMYTKFQQVRAATSSGSDFLRALRGTSHFIDLHKKGTSWNECPHFDLYNTGCKAYAEDTVDAETKLKLLTSSLERSVADQVVRLESQVSILGTAVSAAPFLGLLGTVWGVMDAFVGVATSGSATIGALAPGIASALLTTVIGLVVALPSMVGYNILVANIRKLTMELENFASEFISMAQKETKQVIEK
jgi:biopolymer transport protein TolQ